MIRIQTYSEFLNGREPTKDTKREYVKYLQGIVRGINERVNREQLRMSRDELDAIDTISNIFEKLAREE